MLFYLKMGQQGEGRKGSRRTAAISLVMPCE